MTNIDTNETETASKRATARASRADSSRIGARPAASKSATVMKLLARARGVTILEVAHATAWQPHSVRAFFSGLRKKGLLLVRETRKSGECAYRVESTSAPNADAAPTAERDLAEETGAVGAPTANEAVA